MMHLMLMDMLPAPVKVHRSFNLFVQKGLLRGKRAVQAMAGHRQSEEGQASTNKCQGALLPMMDDRTGHPLYLNQSQEA